MKKLLQLAMVILIFSMLFVGSFWLLLLSSVHDVPTMTYLEVGGVEMILAGLLVLVFYLDKKLSARDAD